MGFSREQHVILLLVGLAIFCIDLFRPFHPVPHTASTNLTTQPSPQWIIEVTGAVTNPGIYVFHAAPTAQEALRRADGPASEGCVSSSRTHCPLETGTRVDVATSERKRHRVTISPMDPGKKLVLGIPIPLNQVDAEPLATIPGISEGLAHRIVNFRRAQGPFQTWNDLKRVRGIGPKRIEKFRSYLTLTQTSPNQK